MSVYIGPSPREREKEREKIDESKNIHTPPPAPTASAIGPCPTTIQIVGRPALEVYPGPSHHPTTPKGDGKTIPFNSILEFSILSDFKMRNVIILH